MVNIDVLLYTDLTCRLLIVMQNVREKNSLLFY
jgi:hypothetical protein